MPKTDLKIYDTETLTQLLDDQVRVSSLFPGDKKATEIEQKSADFLKDFADGDIIVTNDARPLLSEYFRVLRTSSHPQISANLERAENKFKTAAILKNKQQTRKVPDVHTDLSANQFAVLQNKKRAALLTSADLLVISQMLEEEKSFSTDRIKSKLDSLAKNRINKVLKGEIEADEKFDKLVLKYGTIQQSHAYQRKTKTQNSVVIEPIIEPVSVFADEIVPTPSVEPKAKSQTEKKKEAILEHKHRVQELSADNFAILQNKKKMATLCSDDLLLLEAAISLGIEDCKRNSKKHQVLKKQRDMLTTFAQGRIKKVLNGELPQDDNFNKLVSELGTYQQKETFRNHGVKPFVVKTEENTSPTKPNDEKKVPLKKAKEPWYKKVWKKAAVITLGVGAAAVSLFGFGKFAKTFSNSDNNAPQTEQVTKNVQSQQNQQNTKTVQFQEVSEKAQTVSQPEKYVQTDAQAQEATQMAAVLQSLPQEQTAEQAQAQPEQSAKQKALDAKFNVRVQSYKESQDTLGINLTNLEENVQGAIDDGRIELSETLTPARAKYMVAFYAQYPGTEAGQQCNKLLNGEKTEFNKDDFHKWDQELGENGAKFTKSIQAKGKYSSIDHASEQTKKDYQKTNRDFMKILSQSKSSNSHS